MRMRLTGVLALVAIIVVAAFSWRLFSHAPVPDVGATSPPAQPVAWGLNPPQTPNAVIHWTEYLFNGTTGIATDPGANQRISADRWVVTGADGRPVLYHARYTLPDGELYQEIYETPSAFVTIWGKVYQSIYGKHPYSTAPSPQWCITRQDGIPAALANTLPISAQETLLNTHGYHESIGVPREPTPPRQVIAGVVPTHVLLPSSTVQQWTVNIVNQAHTTVQEFVDVGASSHVVDYGQVSSAKASGIQVEQWFAEGAVEVYASPTNLPAWVFSDPTQNTAVCA